MSLTGQLDDPTSPVRRHFESTYPHIAEVKLAHAPAAVGIEGTDSTLAGFLRFAPGEPRVVPPPAEDGVRFDHGIAGAAFDYRLRLLLTQPDPDTFVAAAGARVLTHRARAQSALSWSALADAIVEAQRASTTGGLRDADDELLARRCGLLAVYEQLYRAPRQQLANHPLFLAGPNADLESTLGLVDDRVVDDVMALTRLFFTSQPLLASADPRMVVANPTFDRSPDLGGADADLVVGDTLLELKSVQRPRLDKATVWQLLGYVLADTSDRYKIRHVGWYFARHGYLWQLPVDELLSRLHGAHVDLASARAAFARVVADHPEKGDEPPADAGTAIGPALVERPVSFYPSQSRRGRWHITRAQVAGTEGWREPLGPVCGARSILDLEADPVRPIAGATWVADSRLCLTCLQYTQTTWGRLSNGGDLPPETLTHHTRPAVPSPT